YLGLIGGLAFVTVVAVGFVAYRRRGDAEARRLLGKGGVIGAVLGVVLGIPPVIDQFAHSPGNLGIIRDYFSHPPDATIGARRGVGVLLAQLDPVKLLTRTLGHDGGALEVAGSRVPGAILLLVFAWSVYIAFRL